MTRSWQHITLFALVTVFAAPLPAAEPGEYKFAITPLLGYRTGGDFENDDSGAEVSLDDAAAVGFILNAPAETIDDAYTEWELYFSRQSAGIEDAPTDVNPSLDVDISYLLLGGTYVGAGELVRPFLAAGIGAAPEPGCFRLRLGYGVCLRHWRWRADFPHRAVRPAPGGTRAGCRGRQR